MKKKIIILIIILIGIGIGIGIYSLFFHMTETRAKEVIKEDYNKNSISLCDRFYVSKDECSDFSRCYIEKAGSAMPKNLLIQFAKDIRAGKSLALDSYSLINGKQIGEDCFLQIFPFPQEISGYQLHRFSPIDDEDCEDVNGEEICVKMARLEYYNENSKKAVHVLPLIVTKGREVYMDYIENIREERFEEISPGIYKNRGEYWEIGWYPEKYDAIGTQQYTYEETTTGTKSNPDDATVYSPVLIYFLNKYPPTPIGTIPRTLPDRDYNDDSKENGLKINKETLIVEQDIGDMRYIKTEDDGGEAVLLKNKRTNSIVNKEVDNFPIYSGIYKNEKYFPEGNYDWANNRIRVMVQDYKEEITEEELNIFLETKSLHEEYNFKIIKGQQVYVLENFDLVDEAYIWRSSDKLIFICPFVSPVSGEEENYLQEDMITLAENYLKFYLVQ